MGSIAGYFGFLYDNELFKLIAEVGFFYLMFLAGTEVDLRVLKKTKSSILKRGLLYIAFLYVLSILFSWLFGLEKIFIVIMPLVSVGLILTLLKEYGKKHKWLNLSMIIGTMGEVASITTLTIVGAAMQFGTGVQLYKSLAYLVFFLGGITILFKAMGVLFWWYPELKTYLMPYFDKDEKDIRLSMALFFLMIALMLFLHIEVAFGAFIAGIFIATFFEHRAQLHHKLSSFGFGFLVPIFFVYIGSTFKLESLMMEGLISKALLVTFVMIAIRIISSFVLIGTLKLKESLLFAMSHSMPLTLLIAVAAIAYNSSVIDRFHYYAFILASLFEVIIVTIGIKMIMGTMIVNKPHKDTL